MPGGKGTTGTASAAWGPHALHDTQATLEGRKWFLWLTSCGCFCEFNDISVLEIRGCQNEAYFGVCSALCSYYQWHICILVVNKSRRELLLNFVSRKSLLFSKSTRGLLWVLSALQHWGNGVEPATEAVPSMFEQFSQKHLNGSLHSQAYCGRKLGCAKKMYYCSCLPLSSPFSIKMRMFPLWIFLW